MLAGREEILFFVVATIIVFSAAFVIVQFRFAGKREIIPRGLKRLLEKLLYRGTYVSSETVDALKEVFLKARSLEDLCVNLTETLVTTFRTDKAVFLLKDLSGRNFAPAYLRGFIDPSSFTFDSTDELINCARRRRNVFSVKEIKEDTPARRQVSEKLKKHEIALLVPIEIRGELEGLILLGVKPSNEPYGMRDISLLRIASNMAGIALENVKLYASLGREKKES